MANESDLTPAMPEYARPSWHQEVIANRLRNPAPGAPLELDQAMSVLLAEREAGHDD